LNELAGRVGVRGGPWLTSKRELLALVLLGQLVAPGVARGQDGGPPEPKRGFFHSLGRDFAHVVAPSNLAILGVGGAAALAAHPYDRDLTEDFHATTRLDELFEGGDTAGNGYAQGGIAVATWIAGKAFHSREVTELGTCLVLGQIVNGVLTESLKLAANRTRPNGGRWSFPSGHASAAFTTATVLERHLGWKVGVPAYAAAAYIGASRLQQNKHYASDVLFGAALGIACGRSATFDRGRTRASLGPVVTRRGIGMQLVVEAR
jgi:membrane-associated phospholipid phosphatase